MSDEILVEDEELIILLPKNGVVKGHIIIVPKGNYSILEAVPDNILSKMFVTANKLSSVLFETLRCQGTNILIQNGVPAGQKNNLFSLNVIPRFPDDGLSFEWTPKPGDEGALNRVLESFSDEDKEEAQKSYIKDKQEKVSKKDVETIDDEEENYLVKSLTRTG